jgi:flagellar motor switch protein FliG
VADRPIGQPAPRVELSRPGAKRAAAVLLGLGADVATAVFKQMGEAEVRQIALGAKDLKRANPEAVPEALTTFVDAMQRVGGESGASDDNLRLLAVNAFGTDLAHRAFDGVAAPPPVDEVLGPVAMADPEALAMVLAREQPQTIALVLSSLEPERAAAVMEQLPQPQRAQIVRRMAIVESVAPEVLREVRQALTVELQSLVAEGMRKVDGRSAALEILRRSTGVQQAEVLASIEKDDPALAAELRTKLFTFEDLARLSDRDIQQLAKEIDMKQLTTALKGSSPAVKDKFLKNMSSRGAELLADDLMTMGPVMLSVVEAAQAGVAQLAVQLAESGKITIVRPSDKML